MSLDLTPIINKINDKDNNLKIKGLYIWGTVGVGKTHAMKSLLDKTKIKHEFGEHEKVYYYQIQGQIVVWPTHIANLQKAMGKDSNFDYLVDYEQLYKQRILIIDDIGAESMSDWALKTVLFPLLNYRIDHKLTTFFTSNFSIKQLEQNYKKKCSPDAIVRVIDRIYGLTVEQQVQGKNWRREPSQQNQ